MADEDASSKDSGAPSIRASDTDDRDGLKLLPSEPLPASVNLIRQVGESEHDALYSTLQRVSLQYSGQEALAVDSLSVRLWRKSGPTSARLTISPRCMIHNVSGIRMRVPSVKYPGSSPALIYVDIDLIGASAAGIFGGSFKKLTWLGSKCTDPGKAEGWGGDFNNQNFAGIPNVASIKLTFHKGNIAQC